MHEFLMLKLCNTHKWVLYSVFFVLPAILLGLQSCEREINIAPNATTATLVVDAEIENGVPPLIFLSTSFGYFNSLSLADLSNASIKGAKVTITTEGRLFTMKEYTFLLNGTSISYYAPDGATPLVGKLNTGYKLDIVSNGASYTATTQIPGLARTLDSLWWEPAPANKDTNRVVAFIKVTDPPGLGNYIRYYTSRNDSAFVPGRNSVFDDNIVDGKTYSVSVPRGESRNIKVDQDEYGYFRRGDTVAIKLSNINKATFDFWRTWEASQDNNGNPFGTPVKVIGNISNGALGYFGGYASSTRRIVVPK